MVLSEACNQDYCSSAVWYGEIKEISAKITSTDDMQARPCKYYISRIGISIQGTLLCYSYQIHSRTVQLRFDIGSEANCSQDLCCRPDNTNTKLHTNVDNASVPASRWGEFLCDTTADLGLSAFDSMHHFLNLSSIAFSLFTGDLISHDPDDQQSRAYVSYEETISYHTFKAQLPKIVSRLPSSLVGIVSNAHIWSSLSTQLWATMTAFHRATMHQTISTSGQVPQTQCHGTTKSCRPCGFKKVGSLTLRHNMLPLTMALTPQPPKKVSKLSQ